MSQKALGLHLCKGWYIPSDAESYQRLRKLGFPLVKLHQSQFPLLQMVAKRQQVELVITKFTPVLDKAIDQLSEQWSRKSGRKCRIDDAKRRIVFTGPLSEATKLAVQKLDAVLQKFFSRWCFTYIPDYTENEAKGSIKFTVDYRFNPEREPVIDTVTPPKLEPVELILGFTKVRITYSMRREHSGVPQGGFAKETVKIGAPFHLLEVFTQTGSAWQLVHSGSFIDQTAHSTMPFIESLLNLSVRASQHEN